MNCQSPISVSTCAYERAHETNIEPNKNLFKDMHNEPGLIFIICFLLSFNTIVGDEYQALLTFDTLFQRYQSKAL